MDDKNMKCAVLDDKEGKKYNDVFNPIFSPDSRHMAYRASQGALGFMVMDGKEGRKYNMISGNEIISDYFLFGPNDDRLVYMVGKNQQPVVVVDGKPGNEYDVIAGDGESIVLSPDGKGYAYAAKKGDKWFVVKNGEEGPPYDGIVVGTPLFSPDGKRFLYGANQGDKWFIVLDGKRGTETYDGFGQATQFSPDGKHYSFVASNGGKWFVVVDGTAGPEYSGIIKTEFTDTGVEFLAEKESVGWMIRGRLSYPNSDGEMEVTEEKISWLAEMSQTPTPRINTEDEVCEPCEAQKKLLEQ
jgi:Tol biopolymer transport system component